MILDLILLQAEGAPADGGGMNGGLINMVMIGAVIVVFYFFMMRPQQKKQKEERQFREGLKKGDKVVTIGGIYGRVISLDDNTALIEVDSGTKLKIEKAALKPADQTKQQ